MTEGKELHRLLRRRLLAVVLVILGLMSDKTSQLLLLQGAQHLS